MEKKQNIKTKSAFTPIIKFRYDHIFLFFFLNCKSVAKTKHK